MEGEDEDEYMDEEREQELQSRGDEDWLLCKSRSNPQASYWFHTRTSTRFWHHPQYPYDKIAIIVPFRDLHSQQRRSQQLAKFIPLMTQFLQHAQMPFKLFIIEQSNDNRKFNRGKLLNVGYAIAEVEDYTCFIFHDVDLIPSLELLPFYACRPQSRRPIHIAKVWNRYNLNPNYFGGIVNFSKEQYEEINGYPNNFWGKLRTNCIVYHDTRN